MGIFLCSNIEQILASKGKSLLKIEDTIIEVPDENTSSTKLIDDTIQL